MNKGSRSIKEAAAYLGANPKILLVVLGVLGVLAMVARAFVADHIGQLIALFVWFLLWAAGLIAWVTCWCAARRNPENRSGWWSKRGLVLEVFALFVIGFVVAMGIGHFG